MINAAHALNQDVRRIFLGQALSAALVCAACFVWGGVSYALAALYGGAITLASGFLAYRGAIRATKKTLSSASLYGGLMLRLAVVIALFAIAFGMLGLPPLPLITGFVAAQFASAFTRFVD